MRLIDADATTLTPRALVEAMREGHRIGSADGVGRLLLEEPGSANAALTWVGWERRLGLAVKTATVFPDNAAAGLRPNVQSVVTLFDGEDGRPLAAIHGESFTRMKTAADSALAADILALPEAAVLAVLGAGGQAETHIRFHLAMRPTIRRVRVWNRSPAAAEALAARFDLHGVAVSAVLSAEAAVRDADVVTCLTAATEPVLHGAWLRPGAHVDLVGGYTSAMRESDDEVVRRGRLFADSARFGIDTCGDYAVPLAAGTIGRERIVGDLFDLCSARVVGRHGRDDITVFKNGGGGHLDLMAARAFCVATDGS